MRHRSERPEPAGETGGPALPGEDELRRLITQQLADMCGMRPDEVDPDRPLDEHGLSSRDTVALAGYLETLLDRSLPPTLVWEYPTVSHLASALAGPGQQPRPAAHPRLVAHGPSADDAIAVIGLGCRFPGGAAGPIGDPDTFWSFLIDRGDAVGEVPGQRWAAFDDGSPAAGEALASATRWAAVLPDVAGFDAAFFGISPREAAAMDPQQRILLEVSWEALEHAGIAPVSLRGSRTGVFVGISAAEYAHLTTSDLSRIDAWTATGAATSIAAGRISYLLDLRGPSLAVDTACSSSLLAVHLAVTSLRRRESDLALAGGVNLLLSPVITMTFDAGGGTSPDGRCRPFDAGANGMVRGEGCGVVVLKRLADARREGDRVLAVITATAVNSDGRSNGLVAPSAAAQRDLLRAAHTASGGRPSQVDYVEAHGTGTPLGDPIEAHVLGQVLGTARPATRPLLIGSVKGNIGHLEAAAGVAGLIKTVLALARRQIPPTLHFAEPSPHIPLTDLGLAVPSQATPWPGNLWPPTAGVSAFGFSGTNVHVVLAAPDDGHEANGHRPAPYARVGLPAVEGNGEVSTILLSDKSAERVRDQAGQLAAWLEHGPADEPPLVHIAHTLDRRQGRGPHRSAVIARDRAELASGLGALAAGERHPAVVSGTDGQAGPGVAFVFSGYGSQWPGMGRALAAAEPAFADVLAELEESLREATGGLSLTAAAADDDALRQVQYAQPVLFGFQVALARLWEAHGVHPVAVIGHSMGEVAAAVVSGALSVADGARVIACRSRLLSRLAGAGAMAHVGLAADEVTGLAADLPDVHLAVISSPVQCVVTGAAAQVGELVGRARARGSAARVLDAGGAGHSPQVDPLLAELTAQLADVAARPATTRFYSTAHDDPGAPPRCDASYWAANLRRPVRLGPAVAAAAGDGLRTFVEISPHPLLARALDETVRHKTGRPGVITGTLRRGADEVVAFHAQLATLAVGGYRLPRPRSGSIIDLPPAPWRHERYWADPPPRTGPPGHPLLGPHVELPTGGHAWQRQIGAEALRELRAGRDGADLARLRHGADLARLRHDPPLFPLSAAAEMIIAAACEAWAVPSTAVQVSGLRLVRLLPVGAGPALTTTLDGPATAPATGGRRATVRIHAQDATGTWKLVATGHAAEDDSADSTEPNPGLAGGSAGSPPGASTPTVGVIPRASTVPRASTAIPAARLARGQHIPAQILDRCLGAACADGEIPMAIGLLRVPGPAGAGGDCQVLNVRAGNGRGEGDSDGAVTADLRLTAEQPGAGPPLLEALDVLVSRVPRAAIPVPYQDKLLELAWQPQDLPAHPAMDVAKGGSEAADRHMHGTSRRWIVWEGTGTGTGAGHETAPRRGPAPDDISRARGLAREVAVRLRAVGHRVDVADGPGVDGVAAARGAAGADGAAGAGGDDPPAGVVLVAPEVPHPAAAEHVVLDAVRAAASLAARPGPPPRLWIVTAGSAAARPGEGGDPGLAALRGLVRVLALERPRLRASLVDLDPAADSQSAAATLAAELIADAPDDEVAWRDGSRLVARLARAPLPTPQPGRPAGRRGRRPVVRPEGGYIVTGGCGGLGLVVARWLAERGASRIVLNGRSGAQPEARIALDAMRAAGARVRVVRGDVAQPGVASRLVAAARAGGTPLCGIVHAAGVFADALLGDVTPGDLSRVWAPKVAGAWRLHEATEQADLDWFVLFSSAAALLGSPGQAAYASANAGLDAFAAWRRARGLPATAINWGVWSEAGRAGGVAIRGIDPIGPEEGVEALEALLAEDRTAAGVIRIDPAAAAAAYPEIAAIPFFASLLAPGPGKDGDPGQDGARGSGTGSADWPGAETIRAADPQRRRALMDQRARWQVAAVLGLPPDQLSPDLPLVEAGMDSLAAQRIGSLLEYDFAVTVDPALLLGGATLAQLQQSLAATLDPEPRGIAASEPEARRSADTAGPRGWRYGSSEGSADGATSPSAGLRAVEPRDAAERQVARVAAEVLGGGPVGVTDDLRAAGLTRAARAEIAARLARETGHDLDPATLFAVATVEAAAGAVRRAENGEAAGLIRPIRAGGPKLPVLLAHPAGGTTTVYKTLAGLLDGDRAVFGLERLGGGVSDRCGRYREAMLERFPGGCVLGGWSFGGVLGYETACQLTAAGSRVPLVVLLDAALPLPVTPGDEERVLARRFAAFADYLTRTYGRTVRLPADELLGLTEDAQLELVTRRMAEAGLDGELSPAILRHQQTSYEDTRALERYQAGCYDGHVVLYRAERETPWAVRDPRYEITGETRGWDRLCSRLEVVGIDAHHLNLCDPPAVTVVAAHLRELLSKIGGEQ